MKQEVAGLYLWRVNLDYCNQSLWVTTSKPSIVDAARQAVKALKVLLRTHPDASINTISTHGTLDA